MIAGLCRFLASVLIVSIAAPGVPLPAHAAMLATDAVVTGAVAGERDRIASLLDQAAVRDKLKAYGVTPSEVQARVAALTDEEAAQLAAQIDTLPAGGIIGAIVLVFLVLLATDILGYTKIFPFTRPIR